MNQLDESNLDYVMEEFERAHSRVKKSHDYSEEEQLLLYMTHLNLQEPISCIYINIVVWQKYINKYFPYLETAFPERYREDARGLFIAECSIYKRYTCQENLKAVREPIWSWVLPALAGKIEHIEMLQEEQKQFLYMLAISNGHMNYFESANLEMQREAFILAARNGNIVSVKDILTQGLYITVPDIEAAMINAICRYHLPVVEYLANYCTQKTVAKWINSSLLFAINKGCNLKIEKLFSHSLSAYLYPNMVGQLLKIAIEKVNIPLLKILLAHIEKRTNLANIRSLLEQYMENSPSIGVYNTVDSYVLELMSPVLETELDYKINRIEAALFTIRKYIENNTQEPYHHQYTPYLNNIQNGFEIENEEEIVEEMDVISNVNKYSFGI